MVKGINTREGFFVVLVYRDMAILSGYARGGYKISHIDNDTACRFGRKYYSSIVGAKMKIDEYLEKGESVQL